MKTKLEGLKTELSKEWQKPKEKNAKQNQIPRSYVRIKTLHNLINEERIK